MDQPKLVDRPTGDLGATLININGIFPSEGIKLIRVTKMELRSLLFLFLKMTKMIN